MLALDRAALLDELAAFIDIPSVTGEEGAYAAAAARALADAGFLVELAPVTPQRANVVARRGQGRVLFCTHLDTVPPFFPARRFAGGIAGRGACDAKGAFVCMLAAARALIAR